ncbi:MAG: integrase, partial [Hyphomicrobiales bacterium]|nr:integrase [Hyphomicrobiales bacterium]
MGKVGGERNFGYGKKLDWAGKNALADRYGSGHYATRAAHVERWGQFVSYAKAEGIKDARAMTHEVIVAYGECLAGQVDSGTMAVAYAQNLLSSVNVILETMRGDRQLRVSPAALVGKRRHVRDTAPAGLDRARVNAATAALRD